MSHLHETHQNYIAHLFRAWKIAFILLVHGVFPDFWKTKASDLLCKERLGDDATRKYLLETMWGITPNPSVWDRMSDRELAASRELNVIKTNEMSKPVKKKRKKKK